MSFTKSEKKILNFLCKKNPFFYTVKDLDNEKESLPMSKTTIRNSLKKLSKKSFILIGKGRGEKGKKINVYKTNQKGLDQCKKN